jgi:hypothetical protein
VCGCFCLCVCRSSHNIIVHHPVSCRRRGVVFGCLLLKDCTVVQWVSETQVSFRRLRHSVGNYIISTLLNYISNILFHGINLWIFTFNYGLLFQMGRGTILTKFRRKSDNKKYYKYSTLFDLLIPYSSTVPKACRCC